MWTNNFAALRTPTSEAVHQAWLEHQWAQRGGKEAYDAYWSAYRVALVAAPAPPPLPELLARYWAAQNGEDWDALAKPERDARLEKMKVEIARAVPSHRDF